VGIIARQLSVDGMCASVIAMAVQAYLLFKVNSGMEKEVSKKIAELDEVRVASITYGEYDVIAKITVNDLHALEDFLSDKIRKVPSVVLTSTMIIAQEYKGKNSLQRNNPKL
jgi:DNA-binding Lrp family transcriptional regulator